MSLKVCRGSPTRNNQCTMSATPTQGFKHNFISTSGEKSNINAQRVSFHSEEHWGILLCMKKKQKTALSGSESVTRIEAGDKLIMRPGPLLHSHSFSFPGENVAACTSVCRTTTKNHLHWQAGCLFPRRCGCTAYLTTRAWRRGGVILESGVFGTAQRHVPPRCVCVWWRRRRRGKKKSVSMQPLLACGHRMLSEIHGMFYCIESWWDWLFLEWSSDCGMTECGMKGERWCQY